MIPCVHLDEQLPFWCISIKPLTGADSGTECISRTSALDPFWLEKPGLILHKHQVNWKVVGRVFVPRRDAMDPAGLMTPPSRDQNPEE